MSVNDDAKETESRKWIAHQHISIQDAVSCCVCNPDRLTQKQYKETVLGFDPEEPKEDL